MVNGIFNEGVLYLQRIGVMDIILPFILVFAIVFAILQKIQPFGEKKKNIHVIIALTMGFAVVVPHATTPGGRWDFVPLINNFLPQIAILIIAIVMFLLVFGILTGKGFTPVGSPGGWITVAAALVVLYLFGTTAGWFTHGLPNWLGNSQTLSIIVTIIVFWLIIAYIMRDDDDKKKEDRYNFEKFFNDVTGGKKSE